MSSICERLALMFFISIAPFGLAAQEPLRLVDAEALAIERDPGRAALEARADSMMERSIAAAQWPDPQLRFGLANLPVESFSLSQEPMTQTVIGLRQVIPATDVLRARSSAARSRAAGFASQRQERARLVRKSVRELWLELAYWTEVERSIRESTVHFESLVDVTRSLYATGRSNQQDILRAELELERLRERGLAATQRSDTLRAELARWLGPRALGPLDLSVAGHDRLPDRKTLASGIEEHPLVGLHDARVNTAQAELDAADAGYRPRWSVDLTYGLRAGRDQIGRDREDFASLMFSVDLPIFTDDRQDRERGAATAERRAARAERMDTVRELTTKLDVAIAVWQRTGERIEVYDELVRQSELQSRSALSAYQADAGDFGDLMRAYIAVLDARLERSRLTIERQHSWVEIAYLGGLGDG